MGAVLTRPRQNFMCVEEMMSDEHFKEEFYDAMPGDSALKTHVKSLRRPLTVEELLLMYRAMNEVRRQTRGANIDQ